MDVMGVISGLLDLAHVPISMQKILAEKAAKTFGIKASDDVAKKRIDTCNGCDVLNPKNRKCEESRGGCGCFVDIKAMYSHLDKNIKDPFSGSIVVDAELEEVECPKNKW